MPEKTLASPLLYIYSGNKITGCDHRNSYNLKYLDRVKTPLRQIETEFWGQVGTELADGSCKKGAKESEFYPND